MAVLRVGLAGLGIHGSRYARHLLQGDVPQGRLVAVSRADQREGREFARRHGLTFLPDPRELATHPDVDAVILAVTPDLHPGLGSACVERGRPVLIEKPLALDVAGARLLARTVERHDGFLMTAQTLRFDAVVRAVRREVASIGPLRSVAVNQRLEPSRLDWVSSADRGGLLRVIGAHAFDLLRFLTGLEPVSVIAETGRQLGGPAEDRFGALVTLEPGPVPAVVDCSRSTRSRSGRMEIVGRDAQIWGDHIHRTLTRVGTDGRHELGPVAPRPTLPETMTAFLDAIERGQPPPVSVRDGLAAIETAEAARLSAATGRRVELSELSG